LKVAQVAPLYERVPPRLYGGTERIVSYLTEELVALGHDVTLFASGDSLTAARLVPIGDEALRLSSHVTDPIAPHVLMFEQVAQRAHEFDIIHFHTDYLHFPLARRLEVPHVTTLHGRLDLPELDPLYREFADMPVVSVSDNQRLPLPFARWAGTVHHGLPEDRYHLAGGDGGYLAFLGRISPEKRPDRAIEIARRVGIPLRIAAKVSADDEAYFRREIAPLLDDPLVEFVGEIGDNEKQLFLGNARALLFPIDWPEPFGMVMIESMACGTPVVAFRAGAVPEVIDDGVTGFIVDTMEQAVLATASACALSRERCREAFEERFAARRMALDYTRIYSKVIAEASSQARLGGASRAIVPNPIAPGAITSGSTASGPAVSDTVLPHGGVPGITESITVER
jgi:glycosyltransferase involved in cell wall biosynthesis